jgi:RHH-type proline utilization regulon transcriptional repressor/proline dehydrogenase/delta 1-pyrroline-5-carboxylate dehydrogenase
MEQARQALEARCAVLSVVGDAGSVTSADGNAARHGVLGGLLEPEQLRALEGFDAVCYWGPDEDKRRIRQALADRPGVLIPLITESGVNGRFQIERHLCVDTTAAGGNATLLASAG